MTIAGVSGFKVQPRGCAERGDVSVNGSFSVYRTCLGTGRLVLATRTHGGGEREAFNCNKSSFVFYSLCPILIFLHWSPPALNKPSRMGRDKGSSGCL